MPAMRVGRWSIAVVWLVACGPAIPPLPSRGGPSWVEVTSEHFTLWTDASVERGRELVREMERRRQLVATAMNYPTSKARSFVIALRNKRELAAYVPKDVAGVAWDDENPTGQPGILLAANSDDRDRVVDHELTHVISFGVIKNQPVWLAEGIATYFEMVDLEAGKTSVEIGIPREDRVGTLLQSRPLSIAELFACKELRCRDGLFYATSWALFSFLVFEHHHQLRRYLQRLNEPSEDRRAKAWNEEFADLPLDKLDRDLSEWLTGRLRFPRVEVTVRDVPVRERPLGDPDVLAARCLLAFKFKDEVTATRTLSEVLMIDRTNLLARLIDIWLTNAITRGDARATAAAHPDDWRAWWLVVKAFRDSAEADEALVRMCALSGHEASECADAGSGRGTSNAASP
jgi:hypothetical protein